MYAAYRMSWPGNAVNLCTPLKELLEEECDTQDRFLEADDITTLLDEDSEKVDDEPRNSAFGYPSRPLYRELACQLEKWMVTGHCPILDLQSFALLDEKDYVDNRSLLLGEISPKLQSLQSQWTTWSAKEQIFNLREIVMMLKKRGLLDLLGMRKTVGTVDIWPPARKVLENTFLQEYKPGASDLTVGARALAKHCHRDQTSSWWGVSTGKEKAKNDHAWETLQKILNGARWINIHQLPHEVRVIEVRQENGYGARWSYDGLTFRGFLEPQMVDGHDVGWRH